MRNNQTGRVISCVAKNEVGVGSRKRLENGNYVGAQIAQIAVE